MMKQKLHRVLTLFLLLMMATLMGCTSRDFSIGGKIAPPINERITIKGTWKIAEFITADEDHIKKSDQIQDYIGKTAKFNHEVCVFGKDECLKPEYKMINVSAVDYMQNKFKITPEQIGIHDKRMDIITVTSNNQIFYEFMKINDQTLYVSVEDGFFKLEKQSDNVHVGKKSNDLKNAKINASSESEDNNPFKSGLLLGIRSHDNTYKTLWISYINKKLHPVMETEQLFVPRKKGFWEIGYKKANEGVGGSLYVKPDVAAPSKLELKSRNILTENSERRIVFVGNDYIGTERFQRYQVLPIDHISGGKGITLSDVTIKHSSNALIRSSEAFIASLEKKKAQLLNPEPIDDNFILERRNGHWIIRGRLYYKQPIGSKNYEDFDINVMVPSKLIQYDEMNIPWGEIKSKMPWVIDAYESPNKDLLILISTDTIYIYSLKKGNISKHPLKEIPLNEGDSIVMAEWSLGHYVEKWGEIVQRKFIPFKEK